jgi:hypothetical protein
MGRIAIRSAGWCRNFTLETPMSSITFPPVESTVVRNDLGAIFASLELSLSSWLVTSLSPGSGERMSRHQAPAGDFAALLARFSHSTGQVRGTVTGASAGMKVSRSRRLLRWESSACAGSLRAPQESSAPGGYTSRTSTSTEGSAHRAGRTQVISLTARSIPTQSPRPTLTSSHSRETLGHTKSTFGRGPNDSRYCRAVHPPGPA